VAVKKIVSIIIWNFQISRETIYFLRTCKNWQSLAMSAC